MAFELPPQQLWDRTPFQLTVDLICLHKQCLAVKNSAGLKARHAHFSKLAEVRLALQKRGAKVKELAPHEVDERDAVLKLHRLDCHVRADFKLKVERPPSEEEAEMLFEWLLTAIAQAAEETDEEEEEDMFQEEEIRKVVRVRVRVGVRVRVSPNPNPNSNHLADLTLTLTLTLTRCTRSPTVRPTSSSSRAAGSAASSRPLARRRRAAAAAGSSVASRRRATWATRRPCARTSPRSPSSSAPTRPAGRGRRGTP